jgi:hypothetical protein
MSSGAVSTASASWFFAAARQRIWTVSTLRFVPFAMAEATVRSLDATHFNFRVHAEAPKMLDTIIPIYQNEAQRFAEENFGAPGTIGLGSSRARLVSLRGATGNAETVC